MGVLEKLRIGPESDEEFGSEFDAEPLGEPDEEPDYESNANLDPPPGQSAPRTTSRAKAKISQVRDAAPRITKKMRDDCQAEVFFVWPQSSFGPFVIDCVQDWVVVDGWSRRRVNGRFGR